MSEVRNTYYGRKWELNIVCADADKQRSVVVLKSDKDTSNSLRVTFDINYPGYEGWYYSEIVIYNFNVETEQKVIMEGGAVTLNAGYEGGNYGQIFGGYIFQSLFERENVVDYKLTLRCIDGNKIFDNNFVAFTLNSRYTEQTLLNEIVSRAQTPIPVGGKTTNIKSVSKSRGVTVFGSPATILREYMRTND